MAQPIEQWIKDIPPVTRTWVAAAIGTSLLVVSSPLYSAGPDLTEKGMPSRRSPSTLFFMDNSGWKRSGKLIAL